MSYHNIIAYSLFGCWYTHYQTKLLHVCSQGADVGDLQKKLMDAETKALQAEGETERLLTLVQSSQEEQAIKDKLIKELQE